MGMSAVVAYVVACNVEVSLRHACRDLRFIQSQEGRVVPDPAIAVLAIWVDLG